MNAKQYAYGTVMTLSRQDTPKTILENFQKIKASGMNTVVIWPAVYWWEEPSDEYPFRTGKKVLEIAHQVGLKVIMELAGQLPMMECIPDSLMKDAYYCVDEDGHKRLKPNSFGWLNYFHPEVDTLTCESISRTVRAYKNHPALAGYDIFNETAFHSYDEYTLQQFRLWLQRKYETIEKLNVVWERSFTDFSQVGFSPWMWMSIMPSVDWAVFRKEAMGMILKRWHDAVKREDPEIPTIADNIGSMITNGTGYFYERPQDEYVLAESVDEIGISFYPKQVAGSMPAEKRWTTFDAVYAASGRKGYYISEMQTHIQALFNPSTGVEPKELKQWCCEALSSGAKGLFYWMWRPFTKGLQTSGRGLVDYKGRATPRLEMAEEIGRIVAAMGTVTPLTSRVAILFDRKCEDFQVCYTKCYGGVDQNIYLNSLCGAYKAFYDENIRADIIGVEELENYPVVILSNHIAIGKDIAEALKHYVQKGGVVICDGKTGIVDEGALLNADLPGGDFNGCMGVDYLDTDCGNMDFLLDGQRLLGYHGRELVSAEKAQAIAEFSDGYPAVTECHQGKGCVITVNTHLWYGYGKNDNNAKAFVRYLDKRFDLRQIQTAPELKVRLCSNAAEQFAIVFNYTAEPVTGKVAGWGFDHVVTVPAGDVVILRKEKKRPLLQRENRVRRTYRGGKNIDRLLGKPNTIDSDFPEDWISSFVEAKNREYVPGEGLSRVIVEGKEMPLHQAVSPEDFGPGRQEAGVLVKLLDASQRLGIQVHPTPSFSQRYFGTNYGKTECWHILEADENACVYIDFQEGITREKWKELIRRQDVSGMLNALHCFPVRPGDTVLIRAGTPHAIGAGCFLLEIQEPTDYTMRAEAATPEGIPLTQQQISYGLGEEALLDCFLYEGVSREQAYQRCFLKPISQGDTTQLVSYEDTTCFSLDKIAGKAAVRQDCFSSLVALAPGKLFVEDQAIPFSAGDKFFIPYGCPAITVESENALVCYPPELATE